jgi:hypothetical protein
MSEWTAENLGPRQAKAVNEAMGSFSSESRTYTEITGVHGLPETERRSSYAMFGGIGGGTNPMAGELVDKIIAQFQGKVTGQNYREVIAAYEEATRTLAANRPVKDTRITLEEHEARQARMRSENEERERKTAAARECWAKLDAKRPAWAHALIVAEDRENTSDLCSDYHGHKTVRRVAIGWRSGAREDFRQLRAAAVAFGLAYDDDKYEHRDNYSMGEGNWLGEYRHGGWVVRSLDLKYSAYRDDVFEDRIPEHSSETLSTEAPAGIDGITVNENDAKDGVEIRFPEKPSADLLTLLKARGWRWSRFSSCWYQKRTPETLAFARTLAGIPDSPQSHDGAVAATAPAASAA